MSLLKLGLEPIIEIVADDLTEDEAFCLEEKLIRQYGRRGLDQDGILTNRTMGGKGGTRGFKQPQSVVDALILRNHKSKGKRKPGLSAYIKNNPGLHISARQRGIPHSESRKAANSKTQKEKRVGAKIMTFQSPSGELFRVEDWRSFLIQHDLSYNLVRNNGIEITKGPNAGWKLIAKERLNP